MSCRLSAIVLLGLAAGCAHARKPQIVPPPNQILVESELLQKLRTRYSVLLSYRDSGLLQHDAGMNEFATSFMRPKLLGFVKLGDDAANHQDSFSFRAGADWSKPYKLDLQWDSVDKLPTPTVDEDEVERGRYWSFGAIDLVPALLLNRPTKLTNCGPSTPFHVRTLPDAKTGFSAICKGDAIDIILGEDGLIRHYSKKVARKSRDEHHSSVSYTFYVIAPKSKYRADGTYGEQTYDIE